LLREHRFDGHVAALTVHGLDGLEAVITAHANGEGVDAATMRGFRGWTEAEWHGAEERLRARDLLDGGGALTDAGQSLRTAVEDTTDELAAAPWTKMDESRRERLLSLLRDLVPKLIGPGGLVYPNPIGVSPPTLA
jgi:hypothetical protein